jgi:hypothetical protein
MAGKTTQESIFNNGNQLPGYTQGFQNSNPTSPVSNQPTTTNYLYQTFYRFSIKRLPRINYFAQKVTLPEFASVGAIQQPTRFSAVNHPSTKVSFANLNLEFIIDEKLENWRELYNWMRTIYLVNSYDDFEDKDTMVPTQEIRFHNLLPVSLSGIEFDSTDPDLAPRTATATFAFDFYEFV